MIGASLGIDIGGHGVKGVVLDEDRRVVASVRRDIQGPAGRNIDAVESLVAEVATALDGEARALGIEPERRVGCGIPGFHDRRAGLLRASPNFPGWEDQPVARRLEDRLGRPVVTENDANCALLGEAWAGAARGHDDVVLLTLGTGVGAGFLVGGHVLRGAHGAGGEGGHITLYPGGRPCGCGQRGCLEAYASGPAFVETAKESFWEEGLKGGLPARSAAALFDLLGANPNEPQWLARAVERYAMDLAQGIVTLIHLFQPEAIVLGGGLARALPRFRTTLESTIRSRSIPACLGAALPVREAVLDEPGAVGAAALASGFGA